MMMAARYFGLELDPHEFRNGPGRRCPAPPPWRIGPRTPACGRALRLRWRHLVTSAAPVRPPFNDGTAGLLTGANPEAKIVGLERPAGAGSRTRHHGRYFAEVWSGETILLRTERGGVEADPPFTLGWLFKMMLGEVAWRSVHRLASFLTIVPPLIVMSIIDKVITHHSFSTLFLMSVILGIMVAYETLLGFARRLVIAVIGVRTDARLNLHVRPPDPAATGLLERHPAGETMYRVSQINQVRQFMTGKLMTTLLDMITLLVLLPFLFWLNATLRIVLVCSTMVLLIILAYLRPMRVVFSKVIQAETEKQSALGETVFGIKTVKSLALEPQRKALWDERVAEVQQRRLAFNKLANWPQTLGTLIERFMWMGIILVGAYLALTDETGFFVGSLFAFMMPAKASASRWSASARADRGVEEVGGAMAQAADVLNRPLEVDAALGGQAEVLRRDQLRGCDALRGHQGSRAEQDVSRFLPAPCSTPVGRSGSASTITRLLQGINREYSLREDRQRRPAGNQSVPFQVQFRRRVAGQLPLPLLDPRQHPGGPPRADARRRDPRAARPAGAEEEFIERMPNGQETHGRGRPAQRSEAAARHQRAR